MLSKYRFEIGAESGAHHPRVLLLAPSRGLGGGIERYVGAVEERLRAGGAEVHRVDLHSPARPLSARARLRFAAAALYTARRLAPFDAVVACHPNLITVAAAAATVGRARRGPVIFHGVDIWRTSRLGCALLARQPALYPLAVSSFSAGGLARVGVTPVLRPGISSGWRAMLLAAGTHAVRQADTPARPTLLSVFRLGDADWAGKGVLELLAALPTVRRAVGPVRLVIAGRGPARDRLREAVAAVGDVELVESPDDATLAGLYASADLFVLCTRTVPGHSGEGYGIVLTEAQLAGCPVVGPVSGGPRDAYLDGVTGATPGDESPEALAAVVIDLLSDRVRLARMRHQAAEWARMATEPAEHTRAVFTAVLGTVPPVPAASDAPTNLTAPAPAAAVPPPRPDAQVSTETSAPPPNLESSAGGPASARGSAMPAGGRWT